jgi:hypothetical protein
LVVQRVQRDGTPAAAQYRGPLLGLATGQPPGAGANNDISPACAFELGRLLGAADGRFLRDLVEWHRATDTGARAAMVGADLATAVESAAPGRARPKHGANAGVARSEGDKSSLTTASVKAALGAVLTEVASTPANLWRAHPAGAKIHAVQTRPASPRSAKRSKPKQPVRPTRKRTAKPRKRRT